jgi:hypothetical protein
MLGNVKQNISHVYPDLQTVNIFITFMCFNLYYDQRVSLFWANSQYWIKHPNYNALERTAKCINGNAKKKLGYLNNKLCIFTQ